MKRYNKKLKESLIKKMLKGDSHIISELHKETGISRPTLYNWYNKAVKKTNGTQASKNLSPEDKLGIVIQTASMNELERGEYCRKKGFFIEDLETWKQACLTGHYRQEALMNKLERSRKEDRDKIASLEKELNRKEKALAETAALLVLKKKLNMIWGEEEDDLSRKRTS